MTLPWTAFASAVDMDRSAGEAFDALILSSSAGIKDCLRGIGAGKASSLLAEARAAGSAERRSKLAAGLVIIDNCLAVDGARRRQGLLGRRRDWTDRAAHYRDVACSGLLAGLIDAELGGHPEAQRDRIALTVTALESYLAADRADNRDAEAVEAREAFLEVIRLLRNGMESDRVG